MDIEEMVQEQVDKYRSVTERESELKRRHRRSIKEASHERDLCRSLIDKLEKALD